MIYREELTDLGRFLLFGVRGALEGAEKDEFASLYKQLGDDACLDAARQNQVAALVARKLTDTIGGELSSVWLELLEENGRRVETLVEVLLSVTRHLDKRGVAWALIENGGVLFGSDMSLDAFCAGDFDMLVEEGRWDEVVDAFAAEGFIPQDRRHRPTNRVEFVHETSEGELQWLNAGIHTFDRMWVPLPVDDRGQVWLSRRCRSRHDDTIWCLKATDATALVAMHTSLHSFIRAPGIRLHVDIDRLVRDNTIDWSDFVSEVEAMGVPTRAFVSLSMAKGLLDSPIPASVLTRLYPGSVRWSLLENLLQQNGIVADGRPKLRRAETLMLDALIDERPFGAWLGSILFPSSQWLEEHFGHESSVEESTLQLHLRRYQQMLGRWKPS
jgi:hypothetical protein